MGTYDISYFPPTGAKVNTIIKARNEHEALAAINGSVCSLRRVKAGTKFSYSPYVIRANLLMHKLEHKPAKAARAMALCLSLHRKGQAQNIN